MLWEQPTQSKTHALNDENPNNKIIKGEFDLLSLHSCKETLGLSALLLS